MGHCYIEGANNYCSRKLGSNPNVFIQFGLINTLLDTHKLPVFPSCTLDDCHAVQKIYCLFPLSDSEFKIRGCESNSNSENLVYSASLNRAAKGG
jgi:hypothetical protein